MSIWDPVLDSIAFRLANILTDRGKQVIATREFRKGNQPRQLKVRPQQFDDNLVINFTGLVEDRTVSQMFGEGIKFDFEGDDKVKTPQEEWVKGLLIANSESKLWHNAKQYAGDAGTGYFKIVKDGVTGDDGIIYPRIVPIDPAFVTIFTDPDDVDLVNKYVIEYVIKNGKDEVIKKQETERQATGSWLVSDFISKDGKSDFKPVGTPKVFEYCPIIHWQNLPKPGSQYGEPDIKETDKELQNRINFDAGNISKIIRLYGHPMRYMINGTITSKPDASPDSMLVINGDEKTTVGQFEPLGDLNAAMLFLKWLKQCYFDITRTVDIDSLEDKLGSLTNFALRVIYQDNASKIHTMRAMMGGAITTLLMRCQMIGGFEPLPFEIKWPEFIPVDAKAQTEVLVAQHDAGFVDQDTAITELGRDPENVKERLDAEGTGDGALGARLLNEFVNNRATGV